MTNYKEIKGFEEYLIFNDGRVYSTKRNKFLSPRLSGRKTRQYYKVALYDGLGKPKNTFIHRLVAEHFIPNPENKPVVNHKDNNPLNNHVDNLEWVTESENTLHSYNETNRGRAYRKVAKLNKNTGEILEVFNSIREAGDSVGIHYTCISKVINGIGKSAGGYGWKYYNGDD